MVQSLQVGFAGSLGCQFFFSPLLTSLRKPSRDITDEGEIISVIESTSMASLLTERCYRSTPRGVLTAHAWWLCQCETGACQYHYFSIYRGLERVGSWVPGGSAGRDQLAMAAKVRCHWFNPSRLGSRGRLGVNFSLVLY